jgi:hypothetical protein
MSNNLALGTNVIGSIDGTILTVRIDLSATFGRSASGKSITVATTGGNQALPGGAIIGLNVYRKA